MCTKVISVSFIGCSTRHRPTPTSSLFILYFLHSHSPFCSPFLAVPSFLRQRQSSNGLTILSAAIRAVY